MVAHPQVSRGSLLATAVILMGGCGHSDAPSVGLEVEPLSYYLAPSDVTKDPEFVLTNRGNTTIKITGLESSCGCGVPDLPKSQLAPGGSMNLIVHMSRPPVGATSATVMVTTDSKNTPSVELHATVAAEGTDPDVVLNMTPDHIWLTRTYIRTATSASHDITESQVVVTTIERVGSERRIDLISDLPGVVATCDSTTESRQLFGSNYVQRQYSFGLVLSPNVGLGAFSGHLKCVSRIDSVDIKSPSIPIEIMVTEAITSLPSSLFAELWSSESLPHWNLAIHVPSSPTSDDEDAYSVETTADWLKISPIRSRHFREPSGKHVVDVSVTHVPNVTEAVLEVKKSGQLVLAIPVALSHRLFEESVD